MSEHPTRASVKAARAAERQPVISGRQQAGQPSDGKPRRRWPRRLLYIVLGLAVLGLGGFAVAYAMTPIPTPNGIATAQATVLYYNDGKTEMARLSDTDGNREDIPLSKVPVDVQHAFVAAEDRTFYTNRGVSISGTARGVWITLRGGTTQSGSTITQQYVKNYYLSPDQTVSRKLKEMMISLKIDRQQSKDEILQDYLNTIYFGRGASGIETAAVAYFGKPAANLSVAEGALLASVIRAPSLYDPGLGKTQLANAQQRWAYVLDGMVAEGWLSAGDRAAQQFPKTRTYTPKSVSGTNGYLVTAVKDELIGTVGLTDAELQRGGYRVVTTIDKKKQAYAVTAVNDMLPKDPPNLHAGLVSMVPGDGAIVAMYGGKDYVNQPFSSATQAKIQGGSTFKVFSLLAAMQSGKLSLRTTMSGASPQYFREFRDPGNSDSFLAAGGVRNFANEQFGVISAKQALIHSVNTAFAQINVIGTPKGTVEAAHAAGVTSDLTSNYANVFGTDAVTVVEMASAYATLAARGKKVDPYLVSKITVNGDSFTYTKKPRPQQVFDPDLVADVVNAMEGVVEQGTGSYASALGRPAAGKTGTTTDNYGAWFDGFTPQLATAVGVYRGDGGSGNPANQMNGIPGIGQLTGGTVPVRIWTTYMTAAMDGMKVEQFPNAARINSDATPLAPAPRPSSSSRPATSAPPTTTAVPTPTPSGPAVTVQPPPTSQPTTNQPTPTATISPTKPGGGGGRPTNPLPTESAITP
ncbi:MAG: transglycosylase domain-containing protein [Nostocoides sp.]